MRENASSGPCRGAWRISAADITRLDVELVQRGLARSRARARELIDQGLVLVDGLTAAKAAMTVTGATVIDLDPASGDEHQAHAWVGRGALKLVAALETWPPVAARVAGSRALDVGASTGGFTQVLLRHGAAEVVALDVGHGQLVPELARDSRVTDRSGTSIRDVGPTDLGGPFDIVVADLSFISLRLVVAALAAQLAAGADAIVLVKPQFEVGRERLGSDGVVTSSQQRQEAVVGVLEAAQQWGLHAHGIRESPIHGGSGNVEYLLWLRLEPSATMTAVVIDDFAELTRPAASEAFRQPAARHEGGP